MLEKASNGTAYQLQGPEDGPVLVLVHGLGLTHKTWAGLTPALSRVYRVMSYDLYGHGESSPPPATPSVTLFSDQLSELLDELILDRAAIIGFSLGGMINRRFAIDYPSRVSALVVLNSPHERGSEAQERVEQQAADASAEGPAATLDAAIIRWFTPRFLNDSPDVVSKIRGWILANDPTFYAQSRSVLAHGVKELIRPDPPITHPTLVITCENDSGSTPKMSYDIASEIEGAETIIIPTLRHLGLIEQPELFTKPMLKFLDQALASY